MVERGCSVNKETEVENMAGSTFAAKRMTYDDVHSVGRIDHVDVGNKLLLYSASARHKYSVYLEDQKKHRWKVVADKKRKALSDEVSELKYGMHCILMLRLCLLQLMILQIKQRNCRNYHFWQKQTVCDKHQERM